MLPIWVLGSLPLVSLSHWRHNEGHLFVVLELLQGSLDDRFRQDTVGTPGLASLLVVVSDEEDDDIFEVVCLWSLLVLVVEVLEGLEILQSDCLHGVWLRRPGSWASSRNGLDPAACLRPQLEPAAAAAHFFRPPARSQTARFATSNSPPAQTAPSARPMRNGRPASYETGHVPPQLPEAARAGRVNSTSTGGAGRGLDKLACRGHLARAQSGRTRPVAGRKPARDPLENLIRSARASRRFLSRSVSAARSSELRSPSATFLASIHSPRPILLSRNEPPEPFLSPLGGPRIAAIIIIIISSSGSSGGNSGREGQQVASHGRRKTNTPAELAKVEADRLRLPRPVRSMRTCPLAARQGRIELWD